MNISIVSKQLELTDPIKEHVQKAMDDLQKYHLDIIAVKAIASSAEKNGKKGFSIEFIVQLAGKDTIVIKQQDKDLYAAVDIAIERAKKVLQRHHDKVTTHKTTHKFEVPMVTTEEEDEDEIMPAELDIDKPVEIEEALALFKAGNSMFIIFKDLDDKTRVMYRRKDGKIGLY